MEILSSPKTQNGLGLKFPSLVHTWKRRHGLHILGLEDTACKGRDQQNEGVQCVRGTTFRLGWEGCRDMCWGRQRGRDEIPIMLGRDVGTGVDAGGQGVSNGSTSVTCKIGGSMPETLPGTALESRVPTTVAAKPWVWFPVLSHEPHKPNTRGGYHQIIRNYRARRLECRVSTLKSFGLHQDLVSRRNTRLNINEAVNRMLVGILQGLQGRLV
ncbi:hypothetical protein MHU86_19426 [Fragilaria crotonensis]|nr:hypothetical protein MHU86_19426 [Fragilaria crotonensis]